MKNEETAARHARSRCGTGAYARCAPTLDPPCPTLYSGYQFSNSTFHLPLPRMDSVTTQLPDTTDTTHLRYCSGSQILLRSHHLNAVPYVWFTALDSATGSVVARFGLPRSVAVPVHVTVVQLSTVSPRRFRGVSSAACVYIFSHVATRTFHVRCSCCSVPFGCYPFL